MKVPCINIKLKGNIYKIENLDLGDTSNSDLNLYNISRALLNNKATIYKDISFVGFSKISTSSFLADLQADTMEEIIDNDDDIDFVNKVANNSIGNLSLKSLNYLLLYSGNQFSTRLGKLMDLLTTMPNYKNKNFIKSVNTSGDNIDVYLGNENNFIVMSNDFLDNFNKNEDKLEQIFSYLYLDSLLLK